MAWRQTATGPARRRRQDAGVVMAPVSCRRWARTKVKKK
ncbi:hypothetical protein LINPERHAP1_LOCUS29689 [Linum perenne]